MLKLTLGLSFFGLSSDYTKYLLDEYFILSRMNHISYYEFLYLIPTYVRRYLIDRIVSESNTPTK
jgi:hypothetical protein